MDTSSDSLNTPSARAERLRWLRRLSNKTVREISETYGISADTLKSWELFKFGGLTKKGAQRVLDIYRAEGIECSVDWIYSGIGLPPRLVSPHFAEVKNIDSPDKKNKIRNTVTS